MGYALNGSALGAAMILKHGGLGPDWPRRYLEMGRSYARSGGVRHFFDRLDRTPLVPHRVVAGAAAVFELFRPGPAEAGPAAHHLGSERHA